VKFFWPQRSDAKGFEIGNKAHKYLKKSANESLDEISNQFLDNKNLKSNKEDSKNLVLSGLSIKRVHWANRDFEEYRKAA